MAGSVRELPGIRLGAQVYVFPGDEEEGYTSRIEDLDDGDILGVSAPLQDGFPVLSTGEPVELEVPLPGGSLFLVGTVTGLRLDQVPISLIQVEEVGADADLNLSRDTRRNFRQSLHLPLRRIAYERRDFGETDWVEVSGILRDLSVGGASLFTDTEIISGARVRLDLPLPLDPAGLWVWGVVLRCHESGPPSRPHYLLNVQFLDLATEDRQWLTQQLHRYQWYTRWKRR